MGSLFDQFFRDFFSFPVGGPATNLHSMLFPNHHDMMRNVQGKNRGSGGRMLSNLPTENVSWGEHKRGLFYDKPTSVMTSQSVVRGGRRRVSECSREESRFFIASSKTVPDHIMGDQARRYLAIDADDSSRKGVGFPAARVASNSRTASLPRHSSIPIEAMMNDGGNAKNAPLALCYNTTTSHPVMTKTTTSHQKRRQKQSQASRARSIDYGGGADRSMSVIMPAKINGLGMKSTTNREKGQKCEKRRQSYPVSTQREKETNFGRFDEKLEVVPSVSYQKIEADENDCNRIVKGDNNINGFSDHREDVVNVTECQSRSGAVRHDMDIFQKNMYKFSSKYNLDPNMVRDLSYCIVEGERKVEKRSTTNKLKSTSSNEGLEENLKTEWNDIVGLDHAKLVLQEAIILPMIMPPTYWRGVRRPTKGILLVGPPGTGKTMLAKTVASECKCTFFNTTSSTLTSKYRGDSEKLVRTLFTMAQHLSPSVIFIDEVDSLCSSRDGGGSSDTSTNGSTAASGSNGGQFGGNNEHEATVRFKAELLIQMDGLMTRKANRDGKALASSDSRVLVLAATNHPWLIDQAFRRRFEKRIHVPLPCEDVRVQLVRKHLEDIKHRDIDFEKISKLTVGYSCADITVVCREAVMAPTRDFLTQMQKDPNNKGGVDLIEELAVRSKTEFEDRPITMNDFEMAIGKCKKTCHENDVKRYERWIDVYGSS